MSSERLIQQAKLAEQCERYDDMVSAMTELVKSAETDRELQEEERNLLSVAFKNVIGAKRSSWRVVSSIESKHVEKNETDKVEFARAYKEVIEKEALGACNTVLALLDDYLIERASNVEAKVFYSKMKGDYLRYMTELAEGSTRADYASRSKEAYEKANQEGENLASTHPIKLGLALNYSVFHYEIMNDGKKACEIAKKAFDNAIAELDSLKDESYKDSTLIMQLLRDNLTLWTSENDQDEDAEAN